MPPSLDDYDARNWSWRRKVLTTWVVSLFKFISGLASSAIVPSLTTIANDFGTPEGPLRPLPLSAYFLGYAVGLLTLGPLSETFGRVGVLQGSNIFFIIFNTAGGFAQTNAQLIVLRIMSGIGGAGPLSLGGGILNDCFTPEERTKMISVYALPGQLAPALGPILGAICQDYLYWRWTFWIVTIVSVALQVLAFATVSETYKPVIERRLAKAQTPEKVLPLGQRILATTREVLERLRQNMARAVVMLGTHPIVQLMAVYNGITYGLQLLLIISLNQAWTEIYHLSEILASVNYLSLGVGLVAGAQILRPFNRRIYAYLKSKDPEGKGRPEFRIPMVGVGSCIVPIGLLWYGWSTQEHNFLLVPNLGIFVCSIGIVMILNCTSLYLVDTYKLQSASANGAVNILRALAGFAFPLFADKLFQKLGQGVGSTVLAAAFAVIAIPMAWIFWQFGARMRDRSDL